MIEGHLADLNLPFLFEYKFHLNRNWRFDYAITDTFSAHHRTAIEIEGGIWTGGRHTTGKGFQDDLDKYNSAASAGWVVFRFSVEDIQSGKDKIFLEDFLGLKSRSTSLLRLHLSARNRPVGR